MGAWRGQHREVIDSTQLAPTTDHPCQASRRRGGGGCGRWRRTWGRAYMIAVGYMDPGNWATDIAGGALYQYSLLSTVLLSSLLAIFLQVPPCTAHRKPTT